MSDNPGYEAGSLYCGKCKMVTLSNLTVCFVWSKSIPIAVVGGEIDHKRCKACLDAEVLE